MGISKALWCGIACMMVVGCGVSQNPVEPSGSSNSSVTLSDVTPENTTASVVTSNATSNTESASTTVTSKPASSQPVDGKAQFESELQKLKSSTNKPTMQQMVQLTKDGLKYDKSGMMQLFPSIQDVGFTGDLLVQTGKGAVQRYQSVGSGITYQQASGVYWVVPVTVSNTGSGPLTVLDNMFTLVTSDGRTYAPSTNAEIALVNVNPLTIENLNPWLEFTGYLVFDVPSDLNYSDVKLRSQIGLFDQVELNIS